MDSLVLQVLRKLTNMIWLSCISLTKFKMIFVNEVHRLFKNATVRQNQTKRITIENPEPVTEEPAETEDAPAAPAESAMAKILSSFSKFFRRH